MLSRREEMKAKLREEVRKREAVDDQEFLRVFGILPIRDTLNYSRTPQHQRIYVFGYVSSQNPQQWVGFYGSSFDYIYGVFMAIISMQDVNPEFEILSHVIMILNPDLSPKMIITRIKTEEGDLDSIKTESNSNLNRSRTIVDLSSAPTSETPVWNAMY